SATAFHRALSTSWQVKDIVTTNWDDYFEGECAATPFVTAEDFAFWGLPGRRVLKIHGSVSGLGSIVVTREDYERCFQSLSTGLLGSSLRMMLATKTFLFVGYSVADSDLVNILRLLTVE